MENLYKNIVGTVILEDDQPRPLTSVKDLVIDPETAKVVAVVVDINRNLIISLADIISWKTVIKVNGRDAIIDGDEILRVEAIQKKGMRFMGNKVETVDGKKLGKVVNLSINTNTFDLRKLHIAKGFLGLLRFESRIIPLSRVIEVLPDKIVVKSDVESIKIEKLALGS